MMPFIPFLLVLAGLTIFLSRRRYKAIEQGGDEDNDPVAARVVVKGHTYSDSVEDIQLQPVRRPRVENVRSVCVVGGGYLGGLTGIVLATQNPHVQFCVVDTDERLIKAWNSDRLPVSEAGLEDLLLQDGTAAVPTAVPVQQESTDDDFGEFVSRLPRTRKLGNISFSTNVLGGVAAAEMVFLCVESGCSIESEDNYTMDLSHLESALQAIAQVTTGHKIIVQKSTAPCGILPRIKKVLKDTASPTASFDVLSNPDFIVPGSALQDLMFPVRVVIGHIFSEDMSPTALTALKRLYSWVPEDRILTMDAWSSELGKIAANAFLAQQISSLNSLAALCESTNADVTHVTQVLGLSQKAGFTASALQADILCLVFLARELEVHEVAEYWLSVLRMEMWQGRRLVKRVLARLAGLQEKRVAVLGGGEGGFERGGLVAVVRDLRACGVAVRVFDPRAPGERMVEGLGGVGLGDGVEVVDSVEGACLGCHAVILHSDWEEFGHGCVRWEGVGRQMEGPRIVLDPYGVFDRLKMQEWGMEVLQVGVRRVEALK